MQTRLVLGLSLVLVVMYSLAHAVWVYDHPPMLNDDHFHTEIVLNQLENANLYPNDPAWSNQNFAKSHGFLFTGILRLSQDLFGSFYNSWAYLTFLFLIVYIPGFYLFIYEIIEPQTTSKRIRKHIADADDEEVIDLPRHWLALTLAIGSTMPIYLYVSFANWGITSLYAHVFVTSLSGWVMWGFLKTLKREASLRRWAAFGAAVAMTVYLNPVNGGGLVGILSAVILAEAWGGRVPWNRWASFMAGAILVMLPFLYNYGSTQVSSNDTAEDIKAAHEFLATLYGDRIYPWGLPFAPFLLLAVVLTAGLLLWSYTRQDLSAEGAFGIALVQFGVGYLLIGHPIFLLIIAYWWFPRPLDRWDRLFLLLAVMVNLIAPVAAALAQYFWLEQSIKAAYSLMYEPIRLESYILLPVYACLARWIYRLIQDDTGDQGWLNWLAALAMLATLFSVFGSNNAIKDDAILMKTYLPIRWGLPLFALGLLWLKERPLPSWGYQAIWVIFILLGVGSAVGMNALDNIAVMGTLALFVLLLTLGFALQHISLNIPHQKTLPIFGMVLFFLLTVILPVAGYHKDKVNTNWCDLGQPDLNRALLADEHIYDQENAVFEQYCLPPNDVISAANWVKAETPLDSYLLVLGLQPERFQPLGQRSTVHVNYNQIYWFSGARALLDALTLDERLQGTNPLRPNYLGDENLFSLLTDLQADYIVLFGGAYSFDLPTLYSNESVVIYAFEPQ